MRAAASLIIFKISFFSLAILDSLHYDNTSPRDSDGNELFYDNKKHNLSSKQYQHHKEMRKKTAIDPEHTGLLGETKETATKRRSRRIWNIVSDSKEVSVYNAGRHFPSGSSKSL